MSVIISAEILQSTRLTEAELKREIAVMLFEKEKLTLAQASRLAVMPRIQFQRATAVKNFSWIKTQKVTSKMLVTSWEQELDIGEAEAITLAIELKANLLLLDERRGYQVACHLGLKVTGVLGILIAAKSRGLIVYPQAKLLAAPGLEIKKTQLHS